jgi:hypothetical protein
MPPRTAQGRLTKADCGFDEGVVVLCQPLHAGEAQAPGARCVLDDAADSRTVAASRFDRRPQLLQLHGMREERCQQ